MPTAGGSKSSIFLWVSLEIKFSYTIAFVLELENKFSGNIMSDDFYEFLKTNLFEEKS